MRLALPAICLITLVSAAVAGGSASAGPALDDDKSGDPAEETEAPQWGASPIQYGVGFRARSVWVPKAVLELFVERAAGGAQNYGFGLDLTRRRGTLELQLGFEYENVNVGQGVWIKKGEDVTADEADYILNPDSSGNQLSWFTVEFTFLNHAEISKLIAVRYGGGLGLGILVGELNYYNIICTGATNEMPEPGCVPPRFQGQGQYTEGSEVVNAYELPPVFPVVNAIVGVQIRPTEQLTINVEGGIRTLPFFGVSTSFFF
jgi:hypothetical protein